MKPAESLLKASVSWKQGRTRSDDSPCISEKCQLCKFLHIFFVRRSRILAKERRRPSRHGPLVAGVFNGLAHSHRARSEPQRVIGTRVSWKPKMAVNLLAIGDKCWMEIGPLTLLLWNFIGAAFTARFHDLKVLHLHPDPALKISPSLFLVLWLDVEHIGIQFIYGLLPGIRK